MSAETTLADVDALELGEILEFLDDWIATCPQARASLLRFCYGVFSVEELRADLHRFAFLLGGDGHRFVDGGGR